MPPSKAPKTVLDKVCTCTTPLRSAQPHCRKLARSPRCCERAWAASGTRAMLTLSHVPVPTRPPRSLVRCQVIAAIDALADPAGASRQAIKKFCDKAYGEVKATAFKKALAQGVAKGKLEARGTQRVSRMLMGRPPRMCDVC